MPLPYFGIKDEFNSPVDWGPYADYGGVRSWPGHRAHPPEGKEMTVYYYSPIGEKMPLKVRGGEQVQWLRQRIFKELSSGLQLQALEDDVDQRFGSSLLVAPSRPLLLKEAKDVDVESSLPGDAHFGRPSLLDPDSRVPDRTVRKHAPFVGRYVPPQRVPKSWKELELYVGAAKLYDEEVHFLRSINTGAPPHSQPCTLEHYNIGEGTVIKPEYKQFGFEIKDRNPKQDLQALGPLPTLDTIGDRIWGGLDPDFWTMTVEQAPRLALEFFAPPMGGEGGCSSNCERDGMPHVGHLVPINDRPRPASQPPRVFGRESKPAAQSRPLQAEPYLQTATV